jgi:ClpP class serine protease
MFLKSVADGRGVKPSAVKNGFGQGRMVVASEAIKEGMVDRIATFDQTVARLGGGSGAGSLRRVSAAAGAELVADLEDDDPDLECNCDCPACLADDCANCTDTNCEDLVCQAEGCPNQTEEGEDAAAAYKPRPIALLRRELDLHRGAR